MYRFTLYCTYLLKNAASASRYTRFRLQFTREEVKREETKTKGKNLFIFFFGKVIQIGHKGRIVLWNIIQYMYTLEEHSELCRNLYFMTVVDNSLINLGTRG